MYDIVIVWVLGKYKERYTGGIDQIAPLTPRLFGYAVRQALPVNDSLIGKCQLIDLVGGCGIILLPNFFR